MAAVIIILTLARDATGSTVQLPLDFPRPCQESGHIIGDESYQDVSGRCRSRQCAAKKVSN
jgi:hypothetical protein